MLDDIGFDVRYALRVLRRSPRNTAIAVLILALAIGANTALFSAVNFVILRPLPFKDANRLLRLRDQVTGADGQVHAFNMVSRDVAALDDAAVFDGLVAFSPDDLTMPGRETAERVSVVYQTAGIERTLGIAPALGRAFSPEEERRGLDSGVALVSDTFWKTRLGGEPAALGSSILLGGRTFTIVGVMPPLYAFPYDAQVWLPFVIDAADQTRDFAVFAHMRPGVTSRDVDAALSAVAARVRHDYADTLPSYAIEVMALHESLLGTQDAPLRALTEIVAFLLITACVNVATLLLARSVSRRHEFAVRAALGATRARHMRQLLVESGLLAFSGCVAGLIVAAWLAPLTAALVPTVLSAQLGLVTPRTDWRVMLFSIGASLLSALIAGVVPAFGSWRTSPRASMAEGGRTLSGASNRRTLLGGLIVSETALTLLLVVGSGLVIRNFVRLQTTELGFDAARLLTITLEPPPAGYPAGPARAAVVRRLVDEIRSSSGVRSAAATTVNPLGDGTWGASVTTDAMAAAAPEAAVNVNHRLITPGLLQTMGIAIRRGRSFTEQDRAGTQSVAIVSDRMARRLWPGQDPIGKRVRAARPNAPWQTVVGVAGDVSDSHDPGVPLETWYLPYDQNAATPASEKIYLMVRVDGDPLALVPSVTHAIARVDKTLAPYNPAAMDRYYSDSLSRERLGALFMVGFGGFGLALAALGIYGVIAFDVGRRTGEIGIRMALGARAADILPLVLRRSVALVALGLLIGAAASAALNRALASLLTEVGRLDVAVMGIAAILVLGSTVVAALPPAMWASRLDPIAALRRTAD